MRNFPFGKLLSVLLILGALVLVSCGNNPPGETGTEIIEAKTALALVADGAVLVDARTLPEYNEAHIEGAVSVSRADIVVMQPFPQLVAPAEQIEANLGRRGISNNSLLLAYDDTNNIDAARFWWTLKAYGHENVKVISGGYKALLAAGAKTSTTVTNVSPAVFKAGAFNDSWTVPTKEIRSYLNEPNPSIVLIDTRTLEEHREGHIPGSVHLDYQGNNFKDGTIKPVNQIQIRYIEQNIGYEKEIWMYCKTSIRAAQTFLVLYNAGYQNLRLYDGAWVEWSANPMNPVFIPESSVTLTVSDQS